MNNQQKIIINQKKTIIFHYTTKYQFTTMLNLNVEILKVVLEAKLLGTIIDTDLKKSSNTTYIVKRADARLVLLRKLSEL